MAKYKTTNNDIVELLKHGNLDYMKLIDYAENVVDDPMLFYEFEFGYRNSDCANFSGYIKVFPFTHYHLNFTLHTPDNQATEVILGRYTQGIKDLRYFTPELVNHKTRTKIKSSSQFVSRIIAWHKFMDKTKLVLLENTEKYMEQLDQTTVDDINKVLNRFRFQYRITLDSMNEDFEKFKSNLDYNIDRLKQFKSPCTPYAEEDEE